MTATVPVPIFLHIINYVILCVIRKAINHKTTPKKNKKSLKLSSGLPTEINLVNLMTDLINNSINTLWTMRMMILTQKKNLRKLFKY
jgi:hypothetical protein